MVVPQRTLSAIRAVKWGIPGLICLVMPMGTQAAGLTQMPLEALMNLNVVGASKYEQRQSEVAAAVTVLTRDDIRAFGWRTLAEALASLPGLYVTYDRQYQGVGARGFGIPGDFDTRLLLMINGNRVNDPLYDSGPVGREFPLDMDLVERIEFIPGPGGAVYGQNAMFGVINVITRSGAALAGGEAAVGYTYPMQRKEGRASWGATLDNGTDLVVSASAMRSQGDDLKMGFGSAMGETTVRNLDGERAEQFFFRATHDVLTAEFVYGDRRKDDPTAGYLSDPLVPRQYQSDRFQLLQLRYDQRLDRADLAVSGRVFAGQQDYRSRLVYGTGFGYPATSAWHGFELQAVSTAFASHKLMVGVEYQRNARIDQYIVDETTPANNMRISTEGTRVGVYAQDEWQLTDTVSATLGLRLDRDDLTGTHSSPRAGVIWNASSATSLKLLYGRAHRAPNAYEVDFADGVSNASNPHLRGETITTYEWVVDHRLSPQTALRAAVYRWTMDDLITLGIDPVSGLAQYQSGGSVKAEGAEFSVHHGWQSGAQLRASLSLQDVKAAETGHMANSPRVLGRVNLVAPLPWNGWRTGYEMRYDGRRQTVDGGDVGGAVVSNVRLSTDRLGADTELALTIRNLFDKRYWHPAPDTNWQSAIEQDGRSIGLSLTVGF